MPTSRAPPPSSRTTSSSSSPGEHASGDVARVTSRDARDDVWIVKRCVTASSKTCPFCARADGYLNRYLPLTTVNYRYARAQAVSFNRLSTLILTGGVP